MIQYISYLRLSKMKAGRTTDNSLGLDAQRMSVKNYITVTGGYIEEEIIEIESGTRKKLHKRTGITRAIDLCKKTGATLIIAKLDRLARDVAFVANLQNSHIRFIACDMPNANELTINILAAVAQDEAKRISSRIKDALHQKKLRGEPLGYKTHATPKPKWTKHHRQLSASIRKAHIPMDAIELAHSLREKGLTLQKIANHLNKQKITTFHGKPLTPASISRFLKWFDPTPLQPGQPTVNISAEYNKCCHHSPQHFQSVIA